MRDGEGALPELLCATRARLICGEEKPSVLGTVKGPRGGGAAPLSRAGSRHQWKALCF